MRELHRDQQIVGGPESRLMLAPDRLEQAGEIVAVFGANPELARIGPALLANRGRFEPDQLRAAIREPAIPPPREFAGAPVEFAIATFHWVNGQRIPDVAVAYLDGTRQDGPNPGGVGFKPDVGSKSGRGRGDFFEGIPGKPAHQRTTAVSPAGLSTLSSAPCRGNSTIAMAPRTAIPRTIAI